MTTTLPVEVQLVYEVMPCNALRCSQEPVNKPHPCSYFRKWGTYNSYDYIKEGVPGNKNIQQPSEYLGKSYLVPEILSGCRKAPIMALGINPNLAAFWENKRNSIYPLFSDYKQYAHYFRYRSVAKLDIPQNKYLKYKGNNDDSPFTPTDLSVPANKKGKKAIPTELQNQEMYVTYQELLNSLAEGMKWSNHHLAVGEDLSYGNLVACASAKWITAKDPSQPEMPPMTQDEKNGIVKECFFKQQHFVKQLLHSLPRIVLIFSQTTSNAFISTFKDAFTTGNPGVNEPIEKLLERKIVLNLGALPNGEPALARVIFAPHITGDPERFKIFKQKLIDQIVEEATLQHIQINNKTGHLKRTSGTCTFCPALEIGKCDYEDEISFLTNGQKLYPHFSPQILHADKIHQLKMLDDFKNLNFVSSDWDTVD